MGGDEEKDDKVVEKTEEAEHGLGNEVQGREEVEEPEGGEHDDPQLEGEVETLPRVEPIDIILR